MITVWHGSTKRHDVILCDSWVSTSISEAALYAFLRSRERKQPPFLCRLIVPELNFRELTDFDTFVNGTLTEDTSPLDWYLLYSVMDYVHDDMKRIIDDTVEIIDLTEKVRGIQIYA